MTEKATLNRKIHKAVGQDKEWDKNILNFPPFQELLDIDRQTEIYCFVTDRNVLQITDSTQVQKTILLEKLSFTNVEHFA